MNLLSRDLVGLICDYCELPEIRIFLMFYRLVSGRAICYYHTKKGRIASYRKTSNARNITYWVAKGFGNKICKHAAKHNKLFLLEMININYSALFYGLARGGQYAAIKQLMPEIAKMEDFDEIINSGAYGAAVSANKRLFEYFLTLGATSHRLFAFGAGRSGRPVVLNPGCKNDIFLGACYGGHLSLAIMCSPDDKKIWGSGLYNACYKNNQKIIDFIVKSNKNFNTGIFAFLKNSQHDFIWNMGLRGAKMGGHLTVQAQMINLGALPH